jgi:hypothetical protein
MKIKINKTGPIIQVLTLISILILSVSLASAVDDQPSIPNRFSGDLTLNDEPAPVGTTISAYIGGTDRGSVTVTTAGEYVGLGVEGSSLDDGVTITFRVDGFDADQTEIWIEGSGPRPLDLTTTGTSVPPPSSVDTDGGSSSSGGRFPPSNGGAVDDAGDADGTDTSSVPDDGATSDAPSTEATTTATDESGAGSEEENGTFPWLAMLIIAGLAVVAIIAYLMRK